MTILADTVDLVIGVDPHTHTHTAALVAADTGNHHASRTTCATPQGFAELLQFAAAHDGSRCWVIEGCGSWGRGLAIWLQANGEDVREIDSPSRPARRMGNKTDDLDALRAAREALSRKDLAAPRNTGDRDALAALLVARRSAVEMTGDTERQLVSLAAPCPEHLAVKLRGKNTAQIVEVCLRWRPTGDPALLSVAEAMRALARRIRDPRKEAQTHQHHIEDLVKAWRPDLLQLTGIGPVVAATILNCALHIIAIQRQRHDPATKAYTERRRAQGNTHREIHRCLKRYIARELYRILESGLDKQQERPRSQGWSLHQTRGASARPRWLRGVAGRRARVRAAESEEVGVRSTTTARSKACLAAEPMATIENVLALASCRKGRIRTESDRPTRLSDIGVLVFRSVVEPRAHGRR
jgi:hypothetical protein